MAKWRDPLGYVGGPISGTTITATTQFLAPDGVVGAPGYAFTSSPNTGFAIIGGTLRSVFSGTSIFTVSTAPALNISPAAAGGTDIGQASIGFKRLYIDFTNTGTVGAVTISKAAGRVNIAAAGTSIVVTNSFVTAASKVFAVISQADATAVLKNVVPAAGSFTITLSAAATAQVSIDFFVVNAD